MHNNNNNNNNNNNKTIKRTSNIELLRIVSIIFVIVHHLFVHGLHIWDNNDIGNLPLLLLDAACFIGVNVFILISGYCKIKFSLNKLFKLYFLCFFIGGICYVVHLYIQGASLGKSILYNTLFCISHAPGTWFIKIYFYLFLLAPFINIALENMNRIQYKYFILSLTILSVYFGWLWQDDINKDGYNLMNFLWLYIIGGYIKKFVKLEKVKSYVAFFIWIICSLVIALSQIFLSQIPNSTYNNPLLVISSVAFFFIFVKMNFNSKVVNFISVSTLGVYLIHENSYISPLIYKYGVPLFEKDILSFIISVLIVYFSCVVFESIIRYFLVNPVLKLTDRYILSKFLVWKKQ